MVHILSSKPSRAGRTGASLSAGIPRKTRRCPGVNSALAGTENGPIKLRSDLSNGEVGNYEYQVGNLQKGDVSKCS